MHLIVVVWIKDKKLDLFNKDGTYTVFQITFKGKELMRNFEDQYMQVSPNLHTFTIVMHRLNSLKTDKPDWFLYSGSNWSLELLVFEKKEKMNYPEKILSDQLQTNNKLDPHAMPSQESNQGHIGGRWVLSHCIVTLLPLCQNLHQVPHQKDVTWR